MYTDASKCLHGMGGAVVTTTTKKFSLPPLFSIFNAEQLTATQRALNVIKAQPQKQTAILSDYLSNIKATQKKFSSNKIVQDIQEKISNANSEITFV